MKGGFPDLWAAALGAVPIHDAMAAVRRLASDGVSLRDGRGIFERLADWPAEPGAASGQSLDEFLRAAIVPRSPQLWEDGAAANALTLPEQVEEILCPAEHPLTSSGVPMELHEHLLEHLRHGFQSWPAGARKRLIVSPRVRRLVADLVNADMPDVFVLSPAEAPRTARLVSVGVVGGSLTTHA
jgi:type III secretory pathway component EscV